MIDMFSRAVPMTIIQIQMSKQFPVSNEDQHTSGTDITAADIYTTHQPEISIQSNFTTTVLQGGVFSGTMCFVSAFPQTKNSLNCFCLEL